MHTSERLQTLRLMEDGDVAPIHTRKGGCCDRAAANVLMAARRPPAFSSLMFTPCTNGASALTSWWSLTLSTLAQQAVNHFSQVAFPEAIDTYLSSAKIRREAFSYASLSCFQACISSRDRAPSSS